MTVSENELTEAISSVLNRHANATDNEFRVLRQLETALADSDKDMEETLETILSDHATRRMRISDLAEELFGRIGRLPMRAKEIEG